MSGDPQPLAGQVYAVAGSSRGIGAALVGRLATFGAAVVVNGRDGFVVDDVVEAIASSGGRALGVTGSVADPAVAHAVVRAAVESFGRLDGVANCAGIAEPPGSSILTIDSEEFAEVVASHLTSAFELTRAAAPVLADAGGGSIVLSGSAAATGIFGGSAYPAAKAGVTGLAMAAAADLRDAAVRVNVVLPGARTRLSTGDDYHRHIDDLRERGILDDGIHAVAANPAPAEYVTGVYAHLLSPRSAPLTGEVISAAGNFVGRHAPSELQLLAYADHHGLPPMTLDEVAAAMAPR
ncbi:SDR family NAD(P)-dependent oxidoreductase [Williamsia deligens]|uniref:SDR family NAD(P)-dependent oxidoreductase n=1 Tax=Williamsia deligens TaxID=321325 RepID=A0ABW3G2U0_9NOCA|nr:SDR family NAD(P)-dependent oxidoreductase [Williamsia deligens]MCP2194655.1 NAD(P)-dependent dehydrogenase, short-chain alcohol dehydrogenase family [Williamsia deligens]